MGHDTTRYEYTVEQAKTLAEVRNALSIGINGWKLIFVGVEMGTYVLILERETKGESDVS